VIASGCVPAHASYFTAYELLKEYFDFKNQKYEIFQTAIIGALTTFAHDFFITPSDSKFSQKYQQPIHSHPYE
jgi:hypothetical protein